MDPTFFVIHAARRPLKPTRSSATFGGALSFLFSMCGWPSWTKSTSAIAGNPPMGGFQRLTSLRNEPDQQCERGNVLGPPKSEDGAQPNAGQGDAGQVGARDGL